MKLMICISLFFLSIILHSCERIYPIGNEANLNEWKREMFPVLRDSILNENYEVASDAHAFYDGNCIYMIYSGDHNGNSSIKLAKGESNHKFFPFKTLLGDIGPSEYDLHKETAFYRKDANGKHQIYYIAYDDEQSYQAQIYLAEADSLMGIFNQMDHAVVSKGNIAGKDVYCMTSPSVLEHQGSLYMTFLAWDNSPELVTKVWVIGAISNDHGHNWTDFQIVDTRIGMEGQVSKINENQYVAVRTGEFEDREAIYYSTASHPFGPWSEQEEPILVQSNSVDEINEIIAPQIFIDPKSNEEILYYTGAVHSKGWWIKMAKNN